MGSDSDRYEFECPDCREDVVDSTVQAALLGRGCLFCRADVAETDFSPVDYTVRWNGGPNSAGRVRGSPFRSRTRACLAPSGHDPADSLSLLRIRMWRLTPARLRSSRPRLEVRVLPIADDRSSSRSESPTGSTAKSPAGLRSGMVTDSNRDEKPDSDETETLDLERPEEVQFGVTRGENDLEIGPPRDYPDRADVSVRQSGDDVVLSVDAMAGDHGTGHVDATLTPEEARHLSDRLAETARRSTEDEPGRTDN